MRIIKLNEAKKNPGTGNRKGFPPGVRCKAAAGVVNSKSPKINPGFRKWAENFLATNCKSS